MSKFDQFIQDFDKSINKDTSTISTLSSPTESQFDHDLINNTHDDHELNSINPSTPNLNINTAFKQQQTHAITPTKSHKNSVSYHPLSPISVSSGNMGINGTTTTNGNSRKKGLNLNIMSSKTTPKKPTQPRQSSNIQNQNESEKDMNNILRKMASSEIKIIELKDELKLIQLKIQKEQDDLNKLKTQMIENLNKPNEIKNKSRSNSSPFEHKPSSSNSSIHSQQQPNQQQVPPVQPIQKQQSQSQTNESTQSYWTKPMNLLNQFDQLLQNEFEKLGKDNIQNNNNEDVLKGVSNSLWGFLGDVKSGLMGEEGQSQQTQQSRQSGKLGGRVKEEEHDSDESEDLNKGLDKIKINDGGFHGSEEELIEFDSK
ncbi:putative tyrosine-protein kinase kin-25 [Wickerhamomyces ciferrii]|uniref:Tyrosine-protein kinase kin-25 n=1 Tax=Wickerhamomyces ciferrii (strain ATCC 14091 / BCRC 22168 / CBS 111 / JCM 3599 / NBRC 0793 / NRRL Y-1031 F-60-10) TaxID=1206466 RepID=K0KTH6_WICCF|nr:putative tyrosine-protein kinase kin-25 [Wickerhamomyces ciferrii]CCH46471.1 putative tyrosine-protein kinase kin-25 [Wickerhamomyces ciferrii]